MFHRREINRLIHSTFSLLHFTFQKVFRCVQLRKNTKRAKSLTSKSNVALLDVKNCIKNLFLTFSASKSRSSLKKRTLKSTLTDFIIFLGKLDFEKHFNFLEITRLMRNLKSKVGHFVITCLQECYLLINLIIRKSDRMVSCL